MCARKKSKPKMGRDLIFALQDVISPPGRTPNLERLILKKILLTGIFTGFFTGSGGYLLEKHNGPAKEVLSAISFLDSPEAVYMLILLALLAHFMYIHGEKPDEKHYYKLARHWFIYGTIVTIGVVFFPEISMVSFVDNGFDIPFIFIGITYLYYALLLSAPHNFLRLLYIHRISYTLDKIFITEDKLLSELKRENIQTMTKNFFIYEQKRFEKFIDRMMEVNPALFEEIRRTGLPKNPKNTWIPYLITWSNIKNKEFFDFFSKQVMSEWGRKVNTMKINKKLLDSILDELEKSGAVVKRIKDGHYEYALRKTLAEIIEIEKEQIFEENLLIQKDIFRDILETRTSAHYKKNDIFCALNQIEEIREIKVRKRQKGLLITHIEYDTFLADGSKVLFYLGFEDWNEAESRIVQGLENVESVRTKYNMEQLKLILFPNRHS